MRHAGLAIFLDMFAWLIAESKDQICNDVHLLNMFMLCSFSADLFICKAPHGKGFFMTCEFEQHLNSVITSPRAHGIHAAKNVANCIQFY